MKKYALSVLTMTMALSSGMVAATGPVGEAQSATANLIFTAPSGIAHDVTPSATLAANTLLYSLTPVATGVVTLSGDVASHPTVAVTFTNGTQNWIHRNSRIITRQGGEETITVRLYETYGDQNTAMSIIDDGIALNQTNPTGTFTYQLQLDGAHTVVAGTYPVHLNAQRWEL
ncbi:hypothetical protein [Aeromonas popoffii]|uniref:hypothetical protein n=1 Tax=Aeromonas popoffii TaxID=70856 RepID=UPI0012EDC0B7|nr:hypothetical protein [Aeromonas popoffii]